MKKNLDMLSIRAKLGLTQARLAELLDVDRKYVSMIETGAKPLSPKMSRKLDILLQGGIDVSGATVNGSVIGHGGTVGTPPRDEGNFQEEMRRRMSNIERLLVDLLARSSKD